MPQMKKNSQQPHQITAPSTSQQLANSLGGLGNEVRLLRNLLPALIILVVVVVEWLMLSLDNTKMQLWAHIIFYGLLGPSVTFFTVDWIAKGMQAREQAQKELKQLYLELSASNERLLAVQELMRSLSEASDINTDMNNVLEVAARGAVRVMEATHAQVSFQGLSVKARGNTLLASPSADLQQLSLPLLGGGNLLLHFEAPPTPQTKMLAQAIAAEIASSLETARQRTIDLLTLYSVDQSIKAERNMHKLLARVSEIMSKRLQAECRAVFLADTDGILRLEYAHYVNSDATAVGRSSLAPEFVTKVAQSKQPILISEEEAQQVFPHTKGALGLTMRDEQGLLGVMLLGDPNGELFAKIQVSSARVSLLAFMAGQATRAIRNARAYLYSEELAISDERARIAREIHDGVAQSLAFVALRLDVIGNQIKNQPSQAKQEVSQVSQLLREQIREIRRSIFALRPITLEKHGLLETMRLYVSDFGQQNELKTLLKLDEDVQLSPSDEIVMFRILQESLHNVAKHAQASEVKVCLTTTESGRWVTLRISDNGNGFDTQQISQRVSSAGGLGLVQMRERLEKRGGLYQIVSSKGQGTEILAHLPQNA